MNDKTLFHSGHTRQSAHINGTGQSLKPQSTKRVFLTETPSGGAQQGTDE